MAWQFRQAARPRGRAGVRGAIPGGLPVLTWICQDRWGEPAVYPTANPRDTVDYLDNNWPARAYRGGNNNQGWGAFALFNNVKEL